MHDVSASSLTARPSLSAIASSNSWPRTSSAPAKLRAEWQRDGRIDSVTYSLRQEKVLAFLVAKAQVTEVEKLTQQGTPLPSGPEHGEEGHVHGPDCDH